MFKGKKNKIPERKDVSVEAEVQQKRPAQSIATVNQNVASMFVGKFCKYDFDYDNSYILWIVSQASAVKSPVLTLDSNVPRMKIALRDADTLIKDASVPQDFVNPNASVATTEEEEDIVIL